jgi:hypothetical protein
LFDKTKKNFNIPSLFNILRDFKKFTSKTLIAAIKEIPESRRDWMLNLFWYAGKNNLYSSARDYAREKGLIDIEFA